MANAIDPVLTQRPIDMDGEGRRTCEIQGGNPMTLRSPARFLAVLLAPYLLLVSLGRPAAAQECPQCQQCQQCGKQRCCRTWGCLRCKCFHPKRVCFPKNIEHYGYYPTCWHPWPFPLDQMYALCPLKPTLPPVGPFQPSAVKDDSLPEPQPMPPDEEPKGKDEKKDKNGKKDKDEKKDKNDKSKTKLDQPDLKLIPSAYHLVPTPPNPR
jgi:hypothetical protein